MSYCLEYGFTLPLLKKYNMVADHIDLAGCFLGLRTISRDADDGHMFWDILHQSQVEEALGILQ